MGLTADSGMLNVRWSTEDPNSGARKRKERDAERALLAAAREAETDAEAHKAKQLRAERAAAEADEALLAEALAEEAALPPPQPQPDDSLPEGWTRATDPRTGREFYTSPEGVGTWLRPAVASPEEATTGSLAALAAYSSDSQSDA